MSRLRIAIRRAGPVVALTAALAAAVFAASGGPSSITPQELREWLGYIASDQLQGRAVFSEGFGLAGGYIVEHLRAWGVKPGGDPGQYLQTVRVLGVRAVEEFHEGEPARPPGLAIDRQHDLRRRGDGAEVGPQVGFGRAVGEITDEQTNGQSTLS